MTDATKRKRPTDSGLYSADVDWLLTVAPSELGARSNQGGVVSILEHGGFPTGVPETDIYSDRQMGWCAGAGPVERLRELEPVWRALTRETQAVLVVHYSPRRPAIHGKGADQALSSLQSELGKLASAAYWLTSEESRTKLVDACKDRGRAGRKQSIKAALERADAAVRAAHAAWYAAREAGRAA